MATKIDRLTTDILDVLCFNGIDENTRDGVEEDVRKVATNWLKAIEEERHKDRLEILQVSMEAMIAGKLIEQFAKQELTIEMSNDADDYETAYNKMVTLSRQGLEKIKSMDKE